MERMIFTSLSLLAIPIIMTGTKVHKQPNILFIQCDQLNLNALGCYGGPVPTPNIDKLAQSGVRFTDAICATPSSTPSRGAMITGRWPHQTGILRNINAWNSGITEDDLTTDKILNMAGYDTHQYGKWHLEANDGKGNKLFYYPDMYGMSQYKKEYAGQFLKMKQAEADNGAWMNINGFYFPVELAPSIAALQSFFQNECRDSGVAELAGKIGRLKLDGTLWHDGICAEKAAETIHRSGTRPFAITCSFIWPHDPNFVPDPFYHSLDPASFAIPERYAEEMFKGDWSYRMTAGLGDDGLREYLRIYHAAVKYIDVQVGVLLDALEKSGKSGNTVIVFTADHGDMLGRHGMIWKSTRALYREIVNVPLIINFPALFNAGVCDAQVSLMDLMPTLLELALLHTPDGVAGCSLVPLMQGKIAAGAYRKYNFCERFYEDRNKKLTRGVESTTRADFMVQTKEWKYVRFHNGTELLYDRINDPAEMNNLSDKVLYVAVRDELHGAVRTWMKETGWCGYPYKF